MLQMYPSTWVLAPPVLLAGPVLMAALLVTVTSDGLIEASEFRAVSTS
jgi:hypothetical protein